MLTAAEKVALRDKQKAARLAYETEPSMAAKKAVGSALRSAVRSAASKVEVKAAC